MERIKAKFKQEEEQMEVNRGGRMEAALRSLHEGTFDSVSLRVDFWDESFKHGLAVLCNNEIRINARILDGEMQRGADQLSRAGFCAWNGVEWGDDVSFPSIVEAIHELKVKGWPACFVFAYQQPWTLIEKIFDVVTPVFGACSCLLCIGRVRPQAFLLICVPRKK